MHQTIHGTSAHAIIFVWTTWQCCWLYSGSPCRLKKKYFTFWMIIMYHHSPKGHPARQTSLLYGLVDLPSSPWPVSSTYLVPTYCWILFLGDSHCVGSDVAYDLTSESYLSCMGLVECPDPRPLQPAPPQLCAKCICCLVLSQHVAPPFSRLGIYQYMGYTFTSCQASWCWTKILQTAKLHLMSGILVLNHVPTDSKYWVEP
jgi:hypothetical protein